ncbi:MAG: histidine--tRNA ligase [Endomicrobiales bacterium]|nr:histidine--tRNA ligase [Endomicrobiales bacterium]
MKYKAPRGTHDIFGAQAEKINKLEQTSRQVFRKYNYGEIRLPTFEAAELFSRSIGETTDIVEKEMYVFSDRKGRQLALRPEGTASVVRAYLENKLEQNLPLAKLYYIGSMFRYERPQAGRYREFFQIGAEYFNNPSPAADAEILLLTKDILETYGLKDLSIHVNTLGCLKCRPKYKDEIKKYLKNEKDLCEDCKRRIDKNPLRVLDCKKDSQKINNLPKIQEYLCDDCNNHFNDVQDLLKQADCSYIIDHNLVRGLDYYTKTVFEVRSAGLGAQDALAAGGRYDNLIKHLGGNDTPAVGFALGSERVMLAADNLKLSEKTIKNKIILVAVVNKDLSKNAFNLVAKLRKNLDEGSSLAVEGPFSEKSLKSQLRLADRLNAAKVVIFGEEEYARGNVILRDMSSQSQQEVNIAEIEKLIFKS